MAARCNECVSAGESSLMMSVLCLLERIADGFGEGVRTVILCFTCGYETFSLWWS